MRENPPLAIHSITIYKLKQLLKKKHIFINEEYQRTKVWGKKQEKNLISSIMTQSPIGVLIVKKNNKVFEILDGQQRITAIDDFLNGRFDIKSNYGYKQMDTSEQSSFNNYHIYLLELKKSLNEEEVSSMFIRLQEGIPLNTAEKVNAFVGRFKKGFIDAFIKNKIFFKNTDNFRFRGRLLSAQFLVLELETNFEKKIFPSMTYSYLLRINQKYQKNISQDALQKYNGIIKFMGNVLRNEAQLITIREWIPIYLLTKYLMTYQERKDQLAGNLQRFIKKFVRDLDSFDIYDTTHPTGMSDELFTSLLQYKNIGRKATSRDSIKGRFDIMLEHYKKMFPSIKFNDINSESIDEILKKEESNSLEFKSSMIWDYQQNKVNKDLKLEISQTIAAFLNKDGGTLIVGVDRNKKILGLENDFNNVGQTNDWDAWLQRLMSLINADLGKEFHMYILVNTLKKNNMLVAKISVAKSMKPAFVDPSGKAEFFIRANNTTQKLNTKEATDYIKSRF